MPWCLAVVTAIHVGYTSLGGSFGIRERFCLSIRPHLIYGSPKEAALCVTS